MIPARGGGELWRALRLIAIAALCKAPSSLFSVSLFAFYAVRSLEGERASERASS